MPAPARPASPSLAPRALPQRSRSALAATTSRDGPHEPHPPSLAHTRPPGISKPASWDHRPCCAPCGLGSEDATPINPPYASCHPPASPHTQPLARRKVSLAASSVATARRSTRTPPALTPPPTRTTSPPQPTCHTQHPHPRNTLTHCTPSSFAAAGSRLLNRRVHTYPSLLFLVLAGIAHYSQPPPPPATRLHCL